MQECHYFAIKKGPRRLVLGMQDVGGSWFRYPCFHPIFSPLSKTFNIVIKTLFCLHNDKYVKVLFFVLLVSQGVPFYFTITYLAVYCCSHVLYKVSKIIFSLSH